MSNSFTRSENSGEQTPFHSVNTTICFKDSLELLQWRDQVNLLLFYIASVISSVVVHKECDEFHLVTTGC